MMTLTPAYGRDYKSAAAVRRDWAAKKDFIVNDISSRWDGKPTNIDDCRRNGDKDVMVRYDRLMKIVVIKVK